MHAYHLQQRRVAKEKEELFKEKEDSKLISHGLILDDVDQKCLINRLTATTAYLPNRHSKEAVREKTNEDFGKLKKDTFALKKSNEIAKRARRNSLNKIFDALLVSVKMLDEAKKSGTMSPTSRRKGGSELLDTKRANADTLECPANLIEVIRKELTNASHFISRDAFIEKIEAVIKLGKNAPISAVLTAPHKSKVVLSSEEIESKQCKDKPDLFASKTDLWASQKRPLPGQTIEDYLSNYYEIYERNKSKLREELEFEETKTCPFHPTMYSKSTYKGGQWNWTYSPQKSNNNNNNNNNEKHENETKINTPM
jgi:hypothetical protein